MTLNIAMIVLLSPDRSFLVDFAKQLLDFFCYEFSKHLWPTICFP